jgi:predicted nuclease of predicted toxin-antitoxin system
VRVLLDENMSSRRLAARLQSAGHSAVLASEVGLVSVADARVLAWAVAAACPVLTRDHEDFTALHDLVAAVGGHHAGILVVRFDNDPRHNLTERAIAIALGNLESSGVVVTSRIHVLNHWR